VLIELEQTLSMVLAVRLFAAGCLGAASKLLVGVSVLALETYLGTVEV